MPFARAVFRHWHCTIIAVALPDSFRCYSFIVFVPRNRSAFLPLFLSPGSTSWNAVLRLSNERVKVWTSPAHDRIGRNHAIESVVAARSFRADALSFTAHVSISGYACGSLRARRKNLLRVYFPLHRMVTALEMGLFPSLLSCVHLCPTPLVSTHPSFQLPC